MRLSRTEYISLLLERECPKNLYWYDVAGKILFALMNTPRSYSSATIAYLIKEMPKGAVDMGAGGLRDSASGKWFGLLINPDDSEQLVIEKVRNAVEILNGN